jgi:FlaA1/EpsC-like NDP-sugar epimerase
MKFGSVLITGGSGFFGQGLVRELLRQNLSERICIYSRDEYKQATMRAELKDDARLRWFIGDVRDAQRLRRAMLHGVDLVVHAAALKRVEVGEYNPDEMVKTNIIGSMNVIEAAIDVGVARVVALSTDKACEPANAYGASKLVLEKLFLAANNVTGAEGPRFAVCRYGNVANSTGSVIPTWLAAGADQVVNLTHPDCTRFYMSLADAVRLVLNTARTMKGGELAIPNLPAYRLGDLAHALGVKFRETGLGAGEKMHESMVAGQTSQHARRMTVEEIREALRHVL